MNPEQTHEQKLDQMSRGTALQQACVHSRHSLFSRARDLFLNVRNIRWRGDEPDDVSDKEVLQLILDFIIHDKEYHSVEDDSLRRRTLYNVSFSVNLLTKKFRDYGKDTPREAFWRNWQYIQKFFRPEDDFGIEGIHCDTVKNFFHGIRVKDFSKLKEAINESMSQALETKCNLAKGAFELAKQKHKNVLDVYSTSQAVIGVEKRNLQKMQRDAKDSGIKRDELTPRINKFTHLLNIKENAFKRLQEQKTVLDKSLQNAEQEFKKVYLELENLSAPTRVEHVYLLTTFLRDIDSVEKMIKACVCAEKIVLDSQGRALLNQEKYAILRILEILGEYGSKKNLSEGVKSLDKEGVINWNLLVSIRNKLQHNEYKIEENRAALDKQIKDFDLTAVVCSEFPEIKKVLIKFQKRLSQISNQPQNTQDYSLRRMHLAPLLISQQDESVLRPFLRWEVDDFVNNAVIQSGLNADDKKNLRQLFESTGRDIQKLDLLKTRYPLGVARKSWSTWMLEFAQRRHGRAGVHMAAFSDPLLLATDENVRKSDARKAKKQPRLVISTILDVLAELEKVTDIISGALALVQSAGVYESVLVSTVPYEASRNNIPAYVAAKKYLQTHEPGLAKIGPQPDFILVPRTYFYGFWRRDRPTLCEEPNPLADVVVVPCKNALVFNSASQKDATVRRYVRDNSVQQVTQAVISHAKFFRISLELQQSPIVMAALEYLMGKIYPLLKLLDKGELNRLLSYERQEELRAQRNFAAHGEMFVELDGAPAEQFMLRYLHFYFVEIEPQLKAEIVKFDAFLLALDEGQLVIFDENTSLRRP